MNSKITHEASGALQKTGTDAFIDAFRRHAAGVTVITTVTPDGKPAGFTATSIASLSATPPLATFNMATTASSWPAIEHGTWVAIHVLNASNAGIARRFSGDADQRFLGETTVPGPHGLLIASDASAILIARIVSRTVIGNAATVAVEIEQGIFNEAGEPLLYHDRAYHRLRELD